MARDPETRGEWQQAVDAAAFMVMLHAAKLYGIIQGGPEVDCERCDEILAEGERRGVLISAGLMDAMLQSQMIWPTPARGGG